MNAPKPPAPDIQNSSIRPDVSSEKAKRRARKIHETTASLIEWLSSKSLENAGRIPLQTQRDIAKGIGMFPMTYAVMLDNIQGRLDFACFLCGLPPIGWTIERPRGWQWHHDERGLVLPIKDMQRAASTRVWATEDFACILEQANELSIDANAIWANALENQGRHLRKWAFIFSSKARKANRAADVSPNDNRLENQAVERNNKDVLTKRETQILLVLAKGLTFKDIGELHCISAQTVARHAKSIYRKLEVHSRSEAVFEATKMGLIRHSEE